MTAFPKYPAYKDSGVEWLGNVPEHWEISRSRRVFTQRKELARKDDQQLSATQAYGVIPQADYEERIGRSVVKISMHLEKRKHVEPDDFVISMRSFQGGLERAWARGAIRSSYTVLEPALKVAPSYFAYLFKCPQYIGALQSTGNFIRDGQDLTYQNYILVDLPLPPFVEQERIGAFLDEKTAQIDALMAKKQRQIELLDEQKAILINRAVTRGIGNGELRIVNEEAAEAAEAASDHSTFTIQNSQFKDSGIPWIGPIPKGWSVSRLKHECSHIVDCPHATPVYEPDGEFPAIRTSDVSPGETHHEQAKRVNAREFARWTERLMPRAGDILYSREGDWGISAPVPEGVTLCISQRMMIFRPKKRIHSPYLMWQLNCEHVLRQGFFDVLGSTVPHVNIGTIANYHLVIPPRDEQETIAAHVDLVHSKFKEAKRQIESQIQTLQTLRSTLIAHAVTGKIKV